MNLDPTAPDLENRPFTGLAGLMRMAADGVNLARFGKQLLEHITNRPDDANALMDLAAILHMVGSPVNALARQAQALKLQRLYRLPACGVTDIRLLVIMGPGDLRVNMPVEFLVEGSHVALDMLYVQTGRPILVDPRQYDVAIVAVGESNETRALLQWIEKMAESWRLPVLNAPGRIAMTARDEASALLASAPGISMPVTRRIDRYSLERAIRAEDMTAVLGKDGVFPVIIRPVGSHGGRELRKAGLPAELAEYLKAMPGGEFYVAPYMDYRSPDGLFRKYRIALIDGCPFACHMAISEQWMIHYANAGMAESPEKRAEEARFIASFEQDFALRHKEAFQAIAERMRLDYLVMDCAEMPEGRLLVFETDTGAVIHAMDPVELFPYKQPQMRKVFAAFREMLAATFKSRKAQV